MRGEIIEGEWPAALQKSRIYARLLTDIVLGDLAPGAVAEERAIVERYGFGLAGVREALNRLALEGLVVRRARVGTTVAPLDLREVEHAFEVRRLLEGRSAALAAQNATAADLAQIESAFEGAEAAIAVHDARALVAMDRAFHKAIAWATHNPMLARYLVGLQNVAARYWVAQMQAQTPAEQTADLAQHRALAWCIRARDAAAAEAAMTRLIGEPPSQAAAGLVAPSQAAPSQAAPSQAAPSLVAPSQVAPSEAVSIQAAPAPVAIHRPA